MFLLKQRFSFDNINVVNNLNIHFILVAMRKQNKLVLQNICVELDM